ncbi:MAG: hypothetical protein PHP54_04135 [Clostridia bacterium]|nr:hypothetical protein [Clostridia bacterium]
MNLLYIILGSIILLILLVLFIPVKIDIKFSMKSKNKDENEDIKVSNYVKIYLLRFIRVKKIDMKQKEKADKEAKNNSNTTKKILDTSVKVIEGIMSYEKQDSALFNKQDFVKLRKNIFYSKFYLNIGYNLSDSILNAYAMATLNAIINLYLAKNIDKFNIDRTKYSTYISNKIYDVDFYSIINLKLANTIIVIIKSIIKLKKVVKKDGKQTTSNRKFNDDSYDFS